MDCNATKEANVCRMESQHNMEVDGPTQNAEQILLLLLFSQISLCEEMTLNHEEVACASAYHGPMK